MAFVTGILGAKSRWFRWTGVRLYSAIALPTFWEMPEDSNKQEDKPKLATAPRFPLGQTVATRTALAVLSSLDIAGALYRHQHGDWGDVDKGDWRANEHALKHGERLLSVYHASGVKFYIITEWDRSLMTVLLPEDY